MEVVEFRAPGEQYTVPASAGAVPRPGRPPGFVLVALLQNARGERAVAYFRDEAELSWLRGRDPKTKHLFCAASFEDPDLKDRLARFAAGEALPIKGRANG